MGYRSHRNQPEDNKSEAKQISELKGENQKLKRRIKRLEKQLERKIQSEDFEGDDEEPTRLSVEGVECPSCGGDLHTVNFGPKTLRVCRKCKWRQVVHE